jgi:hypothetical protein
VQFAKAEIRKLRPVTAARCASCVLSHFFQPLRVMCSTTYLGGDGIFDSGEFLLILLLLSLLVLCAGGLFDATDASVDRAGS